MFGTTVALHAAACLYECVAIDALKGDVTRALYGADAKGNELTGVVSKSARQLVFATGGGAAGASGSDAVHALRLDMCRAAYLCVSTVVMKTQSQEKFFAELLFKEDHVTGQLLWDNLVESGGFGDLQFPVETAFPTVRVSLTALTSSVPTLPAESAMRSRLRATVDVSGGSVMQGSVWGVLSQSQVVSLQGSSLMHGPAVAVSGS